MKKKMPILLLLLLTHCILLAQGPVIGSRAPDFRVESGDGRILSSAMIRGKVVLIFYETRETAQKNIVLKNELMRFFGESKSRVRDLENQVARVSVVDASSAFWPVTKIWKQKLREQSKVWGLTIYGDWDGRMKKDFLMKPDESNVLIIDRNGVVRYYRCGLVGTGEVAVIKSLLVKLHGESLRR